MQENKFKCILVGDGGVGKTSLLRRLRGLEFQTKYIPTLGVEVFPVSFETNKYGIVTFNIWDCAGQERFGGLRDGYFIGGQSGILMFDVLSQITYKGLPNWYKDVTRVTDNIPLAVVGHKKDVAERAVLPEHVLFPTNRNLPYFEISTKEDPVETLFGPFTQLARTLMNAPDLEIERIVATPVSPPTPSAFSFASSPTFSFNTNFTSGAGGQQSSPSGFSFNFNTQPQQQEEEYDDTEEADDPDGAVEVRPVTKEKKKKKAISGYIVLLQEAQHVEAKESVFRFEVRREWKIGQEDPHDGDSLLHLVLPLQVSYSNEEAEKHLKDLLGRICKPRLDLGDSYFEKELSTIVVTILKGCAKMNSK